MVDFQNDYLNEKYDALCRERKRIEIDRHNLLLDVEMPEKWRRAYNITGHRYHFPQYIALHLTALIVELEKEIFPMRDGLKQMEWQSSNAIVITRSFSDDGFGANRVYVRLNGNEPDSRTIYHSGFPKQPSFKAIDAVARKLAKKYNLDIQDNLREKGLNWYMIPEA